jgi:hypothetical protein
VKDQLYGKPSHSGQKSSKPLLIKRERFEYPKTRDVVVDLSSLDEFGPFNESWYPLNMLRAHSLTNGGRVCLTGIRNSLKESFQTTEVNTAAFSYGPLYDFASSVSEGIGLLRSDAAMRRPSKLQKMLVDSHDATILLVIASESDPIVVRAFGEAAKAGGMISERLQTIQPHAKKELVLDLTHLFHPVDVFCAELWSLKFYYKDLGKRFVINDDAKLCKPYCDMLEEGLGKLFFPDRY